MSVTLTPLPQLPRYVLRVGANDRTKLAKALGLTLSAQIGKFQNKARLRALCLGPDEWLLQSERATDLIAKAKSAIPDDLAHSLVDVTNRDLSIQIEGPDAARLLATGCPRDMALLSPGHGARTVFDQASVVLWQDGPTSYRLDAWRSFLPHIQVWLERANAAWQVQENLG